MEYIQFNLPNSLLTLFNEGLRKNPEATAVRWDCDVENVHVLSYGNVNSDSNSIAEQLVYLQTIHEVVCLSATPLKSTLCSIIGTLKAECAFAFVDVKAAHKFELNFINRLGAKFMIIDEEEYTVVKELMPYIDVIKKIDCQAGILLVIELLTSERKKYNFFESPLAYCIETSGSTGQPKLVKVPHSCIVFNVIDFRDRYGLTSEDVVFVASPLTFDPSVVDIFLALSRGASMLLVPEQLKIIPDKLVNILTCRNKVTIIQATPSFIRRIESDVLRKTLLSENSSLRVLGLGGEECPSKQKLLSWKHHENKTQIFNVYGITEVSSWASIQLVDFDQNSPDLIPLGEPLLGTEIQVFNSEGMLVTEAGIGHLYVGGSKRICFLGWEDSSIISKAPMRPTGDVVRLDENGDLFYLMRLDDQIKRNGKKVPVKQIETIANSMIEIEDCKLLYEENSQSLILAVNFKNEYRNDSVSLIRGLKAKFTIAVPNHSCPDKIVSLHYFPVSKHGKINKKTLMELCKLNLNDRPGDIDLRYETVCTTILNLCKLYLGNKVSINSSSNFILHGGTSFMAIRLVNEILSCLRIQHAPQLIDKLLKSDLQTVCEYVHSVATNHTQLLDRPNNDLLLSSTSDAVTSNEKVDDYIGLTETISRGNTLLLRNKLNMHAPKIVFELSLHQAWKHNTGKCVDASPFIIKLPNVGSVIYVGSHSHCLYAITADTGQLLWSFQAADRIESTACATTCGAYIFIGSYDQCLYCIESQSGIEKWRFIAGGIIKSSPAYDPISNYIYFGAYDHLFYCIEARTGMCMWKSNISNGSIFSSPCVSKDPHHIYTGTLDGKLACLCPKSGKVLWRFNVDKPIFSSCKLVPLGICVGCVDGRIYCLSHGGEKIWEFLTEEPVFSSSCVALSSSIEGHIICGSHDKHIYCLNVENGHMVWKTLLDSFVYSTPYVVSFNDDEITVVISCCTSGTLYCLNAIDGKVLASYKFPGETFSSPVVDGDRIIIGCRDNFVYSLHLNIK
ncbi:hypothetical protein CHUAL_012879 [Chamberlinius hualienensis]